MKLSLRFQQVIFLSLLLLPAAIFAADNQKGSLNIGAAVQVAGKELGAGDYTVKWDGTGPSTHVNIIRDGKVVASVPARVVKLDQKPTRDTAEVSTASNGVRTLTMIQFEGKAYALQIGEAGGAVEAASGSNVK